MTTYTHTGFAIQYNENGVATAVSEARLIGTVADEDASFGYQVSQAYDDNLADVLLNTDGTHRLQVESDFSELFWTLYREPGIFLRYEVGTINWTSGQTQVLWITDDQNNRSFTFFLSGVPFPPMTTVAQVAVFDALTFGATTPPPPGGYGDGEKIPFADLPGVTTTENDHFFFGNDMPAPFDAGAGDDLIEIAGDESDVSGGDGTDTLRLLQVRPGELQGEKGDGFVWLSDQWQSHKISEDVEFIEYGNGFGTIQTYAELRASIPGTPVLREGGDGDDTLTGGDGNDTLRGGGGNDTLIGGTFHDWLVGGIGDDVLNGGDGWDTIFSGTGNDLILAGDDSDTMNLAPDGTFEENFFAANVDAPWQTGTGAFVSVEGKHRFGDVVDGGGEGEGTDAIFLTDKADAFFLHDSYSGFHQSLKLTADSRGMDGTARIISVERIYAGSDDDVIDLTSPDYSLAGQALSIYGQDGNDVLWGADSDDYLSGGNDNDTIFGGGGSDEYRGGNGADRFEFTRSSTDVYVNDYDRAEGDTLVFYDRGGATFDARSVVMTDIGFTISYLDAATQQTATLTVDLAEDPRFMVAILEDVTDGLVIV